MVSRESLGTHREGLRKRLGINKIKFSTRGSRVLNPQVAFLRRATASAGQSPPAWRVLPYYPVSSIFGRGGLGHEVSLSGRNH